MTERVGGDRREFRAREASIERILARCERSRPDHVSLLGGGEPTLERSLGRLIGETRERTNVPVRVVTNGTLLYRLDARQSLARADVVVSSLNAATEGLFLEFNRPHRSLDFARAYEGLLRFREEFRGRLWLDVMLVCGMNDGPRALAAIRDVIDRVEPDAVRVNTPVHPPTGVRAPAPSAGSLARAIRLPGPRAQAIRTENPTASIRTGAPDVHCATRI